MATNSPRLASLDITRGATVALMILVNNNGDKAHTWPIFEHAPWNGFTLADFVFPAFLFMVGMSIEISFRARLDRGLKRSTLALSALRRSLLLLLLGFLLSAYPHFDFTTMRFYGVLQRIALCFLASALLVLYTRTRALAVITLLLLVGFWILLRFIPVPGFGVPTHSVAMLNPSGNLAAWIDRAIFPPVRLYNHGVYDPCGLLGTLPAIASTLLGVFVARWMSRTPAPAVKLKVLATAAFVLVVAGLAWSPWFPINKRIWTSSYVLFAGGLAVALFALMFALSDHRETQKPWMTPLRAFGTNALAAYILSELLAATLNNIHVTTNHSRSSIRWLIYQPFRHLTPHVPKLGSLLYALAFVLVCLLPMLLLYRRNIFIKI